MPKLLITDLDNTLYDWVSYFSQSFEFLATSVSGITGIDRELLLGEYKLIHQKYHNSEHPYATLELPSIVKHFGTADRSRLRTYLKSAFEAFSKKRKETLVLYPGVLESFEALKKKGVIIVGHTESYDVNSVYRIETLGLRSYFKHLYSLKSLSSSHPTPNKPIIKDGDSSWLISLPRQEKKPNPALIRDICVREGVDLKDTYYVGDSIVKDISMANQAGVTSIWAEYGRNILIANWSLLLQITHWTEEDVKNEENLKAAYDSAKPDYTISSFSEITEIIT